MALLVAMIAWSGAWFWIKDKVRAQFAALESRSEVSGPSLAWDRMRISGFPFRVEVVLDNPRAREPSGWGLTAPQLRAETYAYDLKHWIAYAPSGLVLDRPDAPPVSVTGRVVRASVNLTNTASQLAVQGLDLRFAAAPGASPFPLLAAQRAELHTRPAGPDTVEFLVQLTGGKLAPTDPLGRIAGDAPVSTAWLGTISQASALRGRDWPAAARAWSGVGGAMVIENADFDAGPLSLGVTGGQLTVGPDGRLRGGVSLRPARLAATLTALGQAKVLDPAMAQAGAQVFGAQSATGAAPKPDLSFEDGRTAIGLIPLGPAPRIF